MSRFFCLGGGDSSLDCNRQGHDDGMYVKRGKWTMIDQSPSRVSFLSYGRVGGDYSAAVGSRKRSIRFQSDQSRADGVVGSGNFAAAADDDDGRASRASASVGGRDFRASERRRKGARQSSASGTLRVRATCLHFVCGSTAAARPSILLVAGRD